MNIGCRVLSVLFLPSALLGAFSDLSTRAGFDERGLALVEFCLGTYESPGCYVDIYTLAKNTLEAQQDWDGTQPLPAPLETLVQRAQSAARKVRPSLAFEMIRIAPCHDAPAKKYAVVTFADSLSTYADLFHREFFLLLDGTVVDKARIDITDEQYHRIWAQGIDGTE